MAAHLQPFTQHLHGRRSAWRALASHYRKVRNMHLRRFFADDPLRGTRMTAEGAGLYLDYSKIELRTRP